ncbi:MAG TPA: DNA primase [Solirubrobacteraceae bacterium]|nr:DNA primase [Solirubrobacteraceae bacterium]
MSRYTADSRDRVLSAVDMLALVGTRVELRRAGVNSYFGICPFHDERSGSFHVRPDEKHFHCFGCQESGDPFDFVMQTEGLDFKAAMESLADRFGVALETEDEDPGAAARRQQRERLHALLGRAATFYARYLWEAREAEPAREYLLGRGLTEETLKEFQVGYAPSAWDRMWKASRSSGFSDDELLAAGLVQRSKNRPGQVYDRFRERIMFPAADARGRVRGFGARAMRDNQQPKYLNTSDGLVYHKREVLFGIDRARAAASRADRMILVEGYTDVLAMHQAGIANVVGIMGTALTEEQVTELERIVHVLELCLDADRAGQDAMLRASRLAKARKLELRVISVPEGKDPAELVQQQGAEAVRRMAGESRPFVVFEVERILERADLGSAEGRDRALDELRPLLTELPNGILRDELVRRVAGRLALTEARVMSLPAASGPAGNGATAGRDPLPGPARQAALGPRPERTFLALCIALPEQGAAVLGEIDSAELLTSAALRRAADHLRTRTATPLADLPPDDEELARTVAALVSQAGRLPEVRPERLQYNRLVLDFERINRAIMRARAGGGGSAAQLAAEREHIRDAMRRISVDGDG